jgi:nicotinamidase-related amidase
MSTALLLIDVQQSFKHRPYWSENDLPAFLAAANTLLQGCVKDGVPIVRVFHTDGPTTPDNAFSHASGHVRPLDGLAEFAPALTIEKRRHSALVGTGLEIWLHQQGIRRVIVAGIRTEQCCETTARHASDAGWAVDFVGAATLTAPIPRKTGLCNAWPTSRTSRRAIWRGCFAITWDSVRARTSNTFVRPSRATRSSAARRRTRRRR